MLFVQQPGRIKAEAPPQGLFHHDLSFRALQLPVSVYLSRRLPRIATLLFLPLRLFPNPWFSTWDISLLLQNFWSKMVSQFHTFMLVFMFSPKQYNLVKLIALYSLLSGRHELEKTKLNIPTNYWLHSSMDRGSKSKT